MTCAIFDVDCVCVWPLPPFHAAWDRESRAPRPKSPSVRDDSGTGHAIAEAFFFFICLHVLAVSAYTSVLPGGRQGLGRRQGPSCLSVGGWQ
jgi:hypothetical protein